MDKACLHYIAGNIGISWETLAYQGGQGMALGLGVYNAEVKHDF